MEGLYQETNGLLQQIHFNLASFERAADNEQASLIEQKLRVHLKQINENLERLDILVNKEAASRRRNAKYRVDQLKYDCQNLEVGISNTWQKLREKWRRNAEREELLSRRFAPNDQTALNMHDGELQMNDRLMSADKGIDSLLDHGHAVLDSLKSQRFALKGVKKKMLDVMQQLGVSSTVLRMIERRVGEDKIIFSIGCLATLIFMYIFYRYWKG